MNEQGYVLLNYSWLLDNMGLTAWVHLYMDFFSINTCSVFFIHSCEFTGAEEWLYAMIYAIIFIINSFFNWF